ncbi:MAG: hypothetical protein R6U95_01295 [Bacteroidales bacterium]
MNYFQIVGICFGLAAFLKPFYMHVLPWDENAFLAKTYSKKRPSWIIPVAIAGICLVAFTWYKELTTDIQYSIVITLLFSATAVKAIVFIVDYQKFQTWVSGMLSQDKGKKVVIIDIFAGIFGLILIVLSVCVL